MSDAARLDELADRAFSWVRAQGIVLQSARGPVPNVAEFIAGEPIRGSWWGHPAGKDIYETLSRLDASPEIVATRLINDKVTLLHARTWPALVRVSNLLGEERLAATSSEHTEHGAHRSFTIDYPLWVPGEVLDDASSMSVEEAFAVLPKCLARRS